MGIRYTKLPNKATIDLEPNKFGVDETIRRYIKVKYAAKCPYCNNCKHKTIYYKGACQEEFDGFEKTLDGYDHEHEDRYGFKYSTLTWVRMKFECSTCGGRWESPHYPSNVSNHEEEFLHMLNEREAGNAYEVIERIVNGDFLTGDFW
jgi:hypothetical protein